MCNLYAQTRSQDALRQVLADLPAGPPGEDGNEDKDDPLIEDAAGNLPPLPAIWPDSPAPILRHGPRGYRLARARWGMPTPVQHLGTRRTDPGVTNIRNTASLHWRRWLGVEHRCLVPFTSFAEHDARPGAARNRPVWFALGPHRPLAFFAGIRTQWTSTRRLAEGPVTADLFAFLTCPPNREVAAIHPKAMPVILTRPEDWHRWLTAPAPLALALQQPLPDGELEIVQEGAHEDP